MDVERLATAWYFGAGLCHKQGAIPGVSGCLVGLGPSLSGVGSGQVRTVSRTQTSQLARCAVPGARSTGTVVFFFPLPWQETLANPFFFLIHVVLAGLLWCNTLEGTQYVQVGLLGEA